MATTQDDSNLSVLIAGAGLSGPSLAACLARHRLPFTIFEVARPHAAQPYAITLQRWAYEPLIHALVMHNPDAAIQAFRRDVAVDARVGGTGRVDAGIVDAATGESIVPGVAIGDESHVHANGEMLRQWLIRQAGEGNVRFDARVAGLRTDDRGVTVVLGSGEEVRGRCLVAADGVDSTGQPWVLLSSPCPS